MALSAPESTLEGHRRAGPRDLTAQELIEEAAERIARVVPTDGHFFSATDPETTLAMGAGAIKNLPFEMCQVHWDYEFLVPDYLKFADSPRARSPWRTCTTRRAAGPSAHRAGGSSAATPASAPRCA